MSPLLHPKSSALPTRPETRVECLRHLFSSAWLGAAAMLLGAGLIVVWLHGVAADAYLWSWFALAVGAACARLEYIDHFRRRFDGCNQQRWERRYALLIGISGLLWGALAWMPMADLDNTRLMVIVVVLFSVLLGGGITMVGSILAFVSFAASLQIPLVLRLLTLDDGLALLLAPGVVVVTLVMVMSFRGQRRVLVGALNSRHEAQDLLKQQQVVFESAGEGIVFLKPRPAYVVSCNRRFAELFGYSMEAMRGMEPWRWHPSRQHWKSLVMASLPDMGAGRPYQQVLPLRRADGTLFWAEVTGMAVDARNAAAGTVWVVSDITEQRRVEAALRHSEQRFRQLVKLSSDLYWEQDDQFRFTGFDGPDSITSRLPLFRLMGRPRWELEDIVGVPDGKWAAHQATLQRHEPFRDFVYQIKGSDGRLYWLNVSGNPIFDDGGKFVGYHGTASDITLRIEAEQRYRHLAHHDPLTRLPNRRLLQDRLEQAMRVASRSSFRVALLLIDLDGFKLVNDRHGHAAGDRVLAAVAARLREAVREADTVARLGGDEFVVLLPEVIAIDDALVVADKIHDAFASPISDGVQRHSVGASIGISLFPEHGDNSDALLQVADHAMYHGKNAGGRTTRVFEAQLPN